MPISNTVYSFCDRFLVLGGFADFITPSIFSNSAGAIVGLANVAPHALAALATLSFSNLPPGSLYSPSVPSALSTLSPQQLLREANRLQGIVAKGDRTIALAGIPGTKYLLQRADGLEAYPEGSESPRRPLRKTEQADGEKLWNHENVKALLAEEARFKKASKIAIS